MSKLRLLSDAEMELVAGGGGGEYVITHPPWDGGGGGYSSSGGGGGGDDDGGGGYSTSPGDSGPPTSYYPEGFDHALDDQIDQLAAQIAAQIAAMPNVARIEYAAIIWRDSSGALHATTITPGTATNAPLGSIWGQIDFAGGGQVVSIIHSHPTEYNAGSEANPNWQPATGTGTMSSGDFDQLMQYGGGSEPGYDGSNYRTYIVHGGDVHEFYAFEQDPRS